MSERKTEFRWASIGGADPEPVELVEIDGRQAVYTCGCGDPFYLDDPHPVARLMWLVSRGQNSMGRRDWKFDRGPEYDEPALSGLARPPHPDKVVAAADEREMKIRAVPGKRHMWRGPR